MAIYGLNPDSGKHFLNLTFSSKFLKKQVNQTVVQFACQIYF